jgi:D-glycerate 3-kinase
MELGERILHWVKTGQGSLALPRFDKALDDRCPPEQWTPLSDPPDLLIFEGWCLGVPAQSEHALTQPVNRLEAEEDPDGRWRFYVNERLHTYEKRLFSALDALIVLQAPSFDQVFHWRRKQEEALRQSRQGAGVMSDAELQRFIQHYERLTRHALDVLPGRADVLIPLSAGQQPGKPQWHSDGGRADG